MIEKEKKIFRKMFIVTEYAALKWKWSGPIDKAGNCIQENCIKFRQNPLNKSTVLRKLRDQY